MIMKNFLVLCCFLLSSLSTALFAQIDARFGFKAGANIGTIMGPAEENDQGESLDGYSWATKVHISATVEVPINERIGLAAELGFSQRGSRYRFEADNAYLSIPELSETFEGQSRVKSVNITNGYVEVPILFYVRPIKDKLQLDFGPSFSFLVSSRGLGILKYGDLSEDAVLGDDFVEINLDHSYLTDAAGELNSDFTRTGQLDQRSITYPADLGAYYFFDEKDGPAYRYFDMGLNFGASYYFTKGLRMGARAYYGLLDITNNNYDIEQQRLDDNRNFILRDDFDRNFSLQFFVGLQF